MQPPADSAKEDSDIGMQSLKSRFLIWIGKRTGQAIVTIIVAVGTAAILTWLGLSK